MELLYTLIPLFICSATLFLYERGREEPLLMYAPFGLCLLVILAMSLFMRQSNFSDIEYLSYYYTKVRHYDRWNERQTRTRRVKVGKHWHTQTYHVTVNHPEKWTIFDNGGNEKGIEEKEYDNLRRLWGTEEVFVDMHRRYHTKDGDAQEYLYCGHWQHMRGYVKEHSYENRIIGSKNVMKFKKISDEEADSLGLYHYSDNPLRGWNEGRQKISYINMRYGKEKEIRIVLLVFPASKGVSIVEDQKAYWQGGNKNELVVCVGVWKGGKVGWAESFSWQDKPELDVRCKQWFIQSGVLDVEAFGTWLEGNLGLWERKEFKDFSYINSYLTTDQSITILITTIILSILGCIVVVWIMEDNRKRY